MNQILAIFKKDARHLWPEILVSILITVALVRIYPNTWLPSQDQFLVLGPITTALVVLVPLSWWLLITRLIQSESLVGDRQFWITRPYEWQKLLAAKALFLVVFLYLPTLIAHSILLNEAGFHPVSYLPGLLYNLLLISGIIILPLITLATITSTFVRMTLTFIGTVVAVISVGILAGNYSPSGAQTPGDDGRLSFVLVVSIFLAVIILQYATRRLWLSRAILAGIALLGTIAAFLPVDGYFVPLSYPPSRTAPVQFSALSNPSTDITTDADFNGPKQVSVSLLVKVSGIPAGQAISPDNVLISIDAPNNLHWTSYWQPIYNQRLLPGTPLTRLNIKVDRVFFNQVRALPLSVHLTLALSRLQSGEPIRMSIPQQDFTLPGIGICRSPDNESRLYGDRYLRCRSAVKQPQLSYVQGYLAKKRCSDSQSQPALDAAANNWVGSLDSDPAELSLAPVWSESIYLSNPDIPEDPEDEPDDPQSATGTIARVQPRYLCSGTPLTVTPYHLIGRAQTHFTIDDLHLPPPRTVGIQGFEKSPTR
jgi:hypothetical protein